MPREDDVQAAEDILNDAANEDDGELELEVEDEKEDEETSEVADDSSDEDDEEETEEEEDEKEEDPDEDEKLGGDFPDRPRFGEVNKKFPTLFKEFPGLRTAFFREAEFSKLYPTVEDAKEAAEKLEVLLEGEQKLGTGNPQEFLQMLGDFNPNAQKKFINEFLPTLFKTNRNAFTVITQPLLKNVLRTAYEDGRLHKNSDLENSAWHLHNYIFGNDQIERPLTKPDVENDSLAAERAELEKERRSLLEGKQREFTDSVLGQATRGVDKFIEKNLPEGISDFEKRAIKKEVVEELASSLRSDKAHLSTMDRLMRNASKAGFNSEFKERTTTAYLSRAKSLLPAIIKKVKSEALKGKSTSKPIPKRASSSTSGVRSNVGASKEKDAVEKLKSGKMSELDFLNS